jgi:hypothetical protein
MSRHLRRSPVRSKHDEMKLLVGRPHQRRTIKPARDCARRQALRSRSTARAACELCKPPSRLVHNFIEHQRQHMQNEERSLFPAAVEALLPEGWAEIDARMKNPQDPLFNDVIEKKYQSLHRTILQWERDTEETRKDMHRG